MTKSSLFTLICLAWATWTSAQVQWLQPLNNKGRLFVYWGWNRGTFTNSDIHFWGKDYDFTLDKVVAKDRQSPFDAKVYFNPSLMTIPQYNFRIGYYINNKYSVSFGVDHMKYVMVANQNAHITGSIANSNTIYDGTYNNSPIVISPDFLKFEHTDGLNYANFEFRRTDNIATIGEYVKANLTAGAGAGILYPRTNTTLLGNERYDQFHLAGYGLGAMVGLNIELFKYFFIQTEAKGGFIHMPDIRTTKSTDDRASQHFFFGQANIVFGVNVPLLNEKRVSVAPVAQ